MTDGSSKFVSVLDIQNESNYRDINAIPNFEDWIMASPAFPCAFPMISINGGWYS